MKKLIFLTLGLFLSAFAYSQNCPAIQYTYDAAGNRIQSLYTVIYCGPPNNHRPDLATKDSTDLVVKVYPNPAKDILNLDLGQPEIPIESQIFIYDVMGRKVYSGATSSTHFEIDVAGLSDGTYSLNVIQGNQHKTFNVFKR